MKKVTVSGKMENAHGDSLENLSGGKFKTLDYAGEAEVYDSPAEVKEKGDWPKDSEILGFVVDKQIAAARQAFMKAALDAAGIKKPTLEDPRVAFNSIVKSLLAQKVDETTARGLANAALKTSF